jgi:hypothetical protein
VLFRGGHAHEAGPCTFIAAFAELMFVRTFSTSSEARAGLGSHLLLILEFTHQGEHQLVEIALLRSSQSLSCAGT